MSTALDLDELFSEMGEAMQAATKEPNWRVPSNFYLTEAEQFCRPGSAYVMLDERSSSRIVHLRESSAGPALCGAELDGHKPLGRRALAALVEPDARPDWLQVEPEPAEGARLCERCAASLGRVLDLMGEEPEQSFFRGGLEIDPVAALALLKLDFGERGDFSTHRSWYLGDRRQIVPPDKTCPQLAEAGKALAQAIARGEKIAVYCDYDVDGTSGGAALKLALRPYLGGQEDERLHYGYADAQQGFGLTSEFVHEAHAAGCDWLVTLDCGTGQSEQVALAQSLGMRVIVVDHHNEADNPADFHINPKLYDPIPSHNTGSQLAWKLGAAVQIATEGRTRPEHWEDALKLAGMGCLADMGSVCLPENRAFFWGAAEHARPGLELLAERLGEDPTQPGGMVLTQACLNLPKRTPLVSAADCGAVFTADSREQAEPIVDKLVEAYERAKPVRKRMTELAIEQIGEAVRHDDGKVDRPGETLFAYAEFDESFSDYAGYTGPVAQAVARRAAKPALVFAYRGTDEHGQEIVKFSSRSDSIQHAIGELITDPAMQAACTMKKLDESGAVIEKPTVGGHPQVVSGSCLAENVEAVKAACEAWAESKAGKEKRYFYKPPWDGPEATLLARKVPAQRLEAIEQAAPRLAPFGTKQLLIPAGHGRPEKEATHRELMLSVCGKLSPLEPDPENERWLAGKLELGNGIEREVRFPADAEPPAGQAEFVLRIGTGGPYYLRLFHELEQPAAEPTLAASA